MDEFKKLGVIEPILKALKDMDISKPTLVQSKAIPPVIEGKNVIAGSATGSGKTLAFGAGIVQKIEKGAGVQSLILSPTRELAEQIYQEMKKFSKYLGLNIAIVYGGVGINPQIAALKKAEIVVGTPGRILDHLQRQTLDLSQADKLVLDEADIMFDMGFIEDVEKIISQCAKERQMLLFSATVTAYVDHVTKKYMHNAVKVNATSYVDPKKLTQVYYDVPDNLKFSLLVHLMKAEKSDLVMVFCNTKRNVDFVAKNLQANGVKAMAIHGGFSQDKRHKAMDTFKSQGIKVLVCTDVAARGLDIGGVSHVYNYDIPKEAKQYIHRIGRTARAGSEGCAINILAEFDHDNFSRVLREFDVKIKKRQRPHIERVIVKKVERAPRRPGGFGRGRSDGPRRGSSRAGSPRSGGRSSPGGRGGPRRGSQGGRSGPRRSNADGPRSGGPRRGSSGPRRGGSHTGGPKRGPQRGRSGHSSARRSSGAVRSQSDSMPVYRESGWTSLFE